MYIQVWQIHVQKYYFIHSQPEVRILKKLSTSSSPNKYTINESLNGQAKTKTCIIYKVGGGELTIFI